MPRLMMRKWNITPHAGGSGISRLMQGKCDTLCLMRGGTDSRIIEPDAAGDEGADSGAAGRYCLYGKG